jgi:hypothetical protein
MEINELVWSCKNKAKEGTRQTSMGTTIRVPQRPLAILFLGSHDRNCRAEVERTLSFCWPAGGYNSVSITSYETPEQFRKALTYDENDHMELEDLVIEQCKNQKNFQVHTNVILVYFLNLDQEDAEEYLELLDEKPDLGTGGLITRVVFAMSSCQRRTEKEQVHQRLNQLSQMAQEDRNQVWRNTIVVSLSNNLYDGSTLDEEQFGEGYSLAVEMLQLYNSARLPGDPVIYFPMANDPEYNLVTGAIQRIQKPFDEIVRTVLRQYLYSCQIACSDQAEDKRVNGQELLEMCNQAMLDFMNQRVYGALPVNADLGGLPNGVTQPRDAGEDGGTDRTCGVWKAYKEKYYVGKVDEACGSDEALQDYFEDYFSQRYSCGVFCSEFAGLALKLQEKGSQFYPNPPTGSTELAAFGRYAAYCRMVERGLPAMIAAARQLSQDAETYMNNLNRLAVNLNPKDPSVISFYSPEVKNYLDGLSADNGIKARMKRPCGEEKLRERVEEFFNEVMNRPFMKLPFDQELARRIGQAQASHVLSNVLNQSETAMGICARMSLNNLNSIGDVVLLDTGAGFASGTAIAGVPFQVSRSDCVDRIAFYRFNVKMVH